MAGRLIVTIQGADVVAAKLTDPTLISGALDWLGEEAKAVGQRTAIEAVDGGTGVAVRSIIGVTGMQAAPDTMRVVTMMPRARAWSIEQGRPAGTAPPLGQIINWRHAVGHPETGIAVALGIRDRGVRGRFFMQAARQAVSTALPSLLSRAAEMITARWRTS